MIHALRSEWIKLRTIRMNWILVLIGVAFPVIVCVLTAALEKDRDFDAQDLIDLVQTCSLVTSLLLGVVGAATITGEFGFGTIRPTFAAMPRRYVVVVAKAIVTVVVAMAVEAAVVLGTYAVAGAISRSRDRRIVLDDAPNGSAAMLGIVLLAAIIALLGYGLGLLLRNTPAAVSVLLLWPLLVEPLVGALLHAVGVEHPFKWLPYNAGIGIANPEADPDTAEHLARLAGGLYFFGVAAAIALLGAVLTDRRDA